MKSVLKETGAIKDFWLEPFSRKVYPRAVGLTNLEGSVIEWTSFAPNRYNQVVLKPLRANGLLLDFSMEVGGYARLKIRCDDQFSLGVQAVESTGHIVKPVLSRLLSGRDPGIKDFRIKINKDCVAEVPHCGGFRYLWVYPLSFGSVRIEKAWVEYTPHIPESPDSTGYFLCSDEILNRAWFAGMHTVEVCTIDPKLGGPDSNSRVGEGEWVIIDGAKRDRLIWTAGLSPAGAAQYMSVYNTDAVRDSLLSLGKLQRKDGYIPACSQTNLLTKIGGSLFGDYVAWWIITLYQYYLHTADRETIRELFPVVKRALSYLHSQTRGGLFRQTPFNGCEWCFSIWRQGRPSYTNIVYYWALNCASFLAYELGEDEFSTGCVSRAYRLGEAVFRELWNSQKGVFIDTTENGKRVPQDANCLSIVSGLVSEPEEVIRILDYIRGTMWEPWGSVNVDVPYLRHISSALIPHNRKVVPFMNNFEVLARFMAQDNRNAVELIRRCWGNMVENEPGSTFWEWVGNGGKVDIHPVSLCHSWSAGVAALLSKFVLGVRPAGVGYIKFRFDPRCEGLDWVEGRLPTPYGFIEARVERKGDSYIRTFKAPKGVELA